MRAGGLDHQITIERLSSEIDDYGNPVESWSTVATVRAQVIQASTEEFIRGYGASSESVVVFRTRWLEGVTLADRLTHNGQLHDIKETKEIGRRRGLEIRTIARQS